MRRIHTLLFAAGIVTALGFGSASAFAKPTMGGMWRYCPAYLDEASCVNCCEQFAAEAYDYDPATGVCRCWV